MLPKGYRLNKDRDFKKIASGAKPIHSQILLIKKLSTAEKITKFGIVVSAKISKKAIVRNKIKRRIREIIYSYLPQIKAGYKVMIIVKSTALTKDFKEIKKDLTELLIKSQLL